MISPAKTPLLAVIATLALAVGCTCELEPPAPIDEQSSPRASRVSDAALPAPPSLAVVKTTQPPVLDGALSDSTWRFSQSTGPFVETRQGGRTAVEAEAKLLWDERFLYVAVAVRDALLRASDTTRDARLWEQDCVELMIEPRGDGSGYYEIQVSPRGVVFDTRYDARRVPRPFGHMDWDSKVRVGVSTRGAIDDAKDDYGYSVEIAIPWQAFSLERGALPQPTIGERWRANIYVMDLGDDRQRAAAWSPLGVGDFHVPERFGILAFEGAPEGMRSDDAPIRISADRIPRSLGRGGAPTRGSGGSVIRERTSDPRKPAKPPRSSIRTDAQRLESTEAAH
jgi:hypothetical protein